MHLEKLKCRNKENKGTLTVPEWRWELAFEDSARFLPISQEGICKVFLKTWRNKDCSLSRNWITWVGHCSPQLTLKNAGMDSFLFSLPLLLRTTMVQWVWKATLSRCWEIRLQLAVSCTWASPKKRGVSDAPWPHRDEPAPAPRLGDCRKETCPWEGSNSHKKTGNMLMCSLLVAWGMPSRVPAKKQHRAVLLYPADPQPSPSLACPRQFPRKGSWETEEFLMLTNVVHCRYNLPLKVIMAILYTFSWTVICEQWAFLQKCEFNNPKALLIYAIKLIQRII